MQTFKGKMPGCLLKGGLAFLFAKKDNPEGNLPNNLLTLSSFLFKYNKMTRSLPSLPILLLPDANESEAGR